MNRSTPQSIVEGARIADETHLAAEVQKARDAANEYLARVDKARNDAARARNQYASANSASAMAEVEVQLLVDRTEKLRAEALQYGPIAPPDNSLAKKSLQEMENELVLTREQHSTLNSRVEQLRQRRNSLASQLMTTRSELEEMLRISHTAASIRSNIESARATDLAERCKLLNDRASDQESVLRQLAAERRSMAEHLSSGCVQRFNTLAARRNSLRLNADNRDFVRNILDENRAARDKLLSIYTGAQFEAEEQLSLIGILKGRVDAELCTAASRASRFTNM